MSDILHVTPTDADGHDFRQLLQNLLGLIHVAGSPHLWTVLQKMKGMADWEDYPFPNISHWMEARDLCWLLECMKHLDDGPAIFTGGKWATIQNGQALVDREAIRAVRNKPQP